MSNGVREALDAAEFEVWVKQGAAAVGITLSQEALDKAEQDTEA
jgi:hypothetical protein